MWELAGSIVAEAMKQAGIVRARPKETLPLQFFEDLDKSDLPPISEPPAESTVPTIQTTEANLIRG